MSKGYRFIARAAVVVAVLTVLTGCPYGFRGTQAAITFDGLSQTFHVGDQYEAEGVTLTFLPYMTISSGLISDGVAYIAPDNYVGGGGMELQLFNINVGFDYKGYVDMVTMQYDYMGTSTNVFVDGGMSVSTNFQSHDFGAVDLTVQAPGANPGVATFNGIMPLDEFTELAEWGRYNLIIGGDEFAIDNVVSGVD